MDDMQHVTHTQTQFAFTLDLKRKCLSIVAALLAVGSLPWATESCMAETGQSSPDSPVHFFSKTGWQLGIYWSGNIYALSDESET